MRLTLTRIRAHRIMGMITGTAGRDRCRAITVPRCRGLPGPDGYCPTHRLPPLPGRPA
jgi:hypothetical protein